MKNKLIDLNNHLFAQLERLSDESINGDQLQNEIDRSKAVASVAREIINTGKLALDAQKALADDQINFLPNMLGIDHEGK